MRRKAFRIIVTLLVQWSVIGGCFVAFIDRVYTPFIVPFTNHPGFYFRILDMLSWVVAIMLSAIFANFAVAGLALNCGWDDIATLKPKVNESN